MRSFEGKVLVVVDMEPGYRKSMNVEQYRAVRTLIRAARRADAYIVFLEFMDQGTYPDLLSLVRGYDCFVKEAKGQCDGSLEVLAACRRAEYETDTFVVCGVDTHACVHHTAQQLARRQPKSKVEVVMEGCGTQRNNGGNDWQRFPKETNLELVSLRELAA